MTGMHCISVYISVMKLESGFRKNADWRTFWGDFSQMKG